MTTLPVDFATKLKVAKSASGGGYPVQISAGDLMKNFSWAALDADPTLLEQTTAAGGHQARKLKIPAVPGSGTHVLGAVGGTLQWIATEEC
jgi:hypothetical protein